MAKNPILPQAKPRFFSTKGNTKGKPNCVMRVPAVLILKEKAYF